MFDVIRSLLLSLLWLPQVEVFINGIPSKCSGDCGFEWSEDHTPVVTGISPTQGVNLNVTLKSKFCPNFIQILPEFCPDFVRILSKF